MSWPTDFEIYEREPIRIGAHTVMLVQLFTRSDHFKDAWTWDNVSVAESRGMIYQLAAEQFHKQLEGRDCIAFWQALRDEADKEIVSWKKRCAEPDHK